MDLQIVPLPTAFLTRVRQDGIDDQHHPIVRLQSATGGEPCRDVLRRARPGEALILASYCPFRHPGPYREYGPIFVLAEPTAEPPIGQAVLAPTGHPADYVSAQMVLRAYSAEETIVDGALVTPATLLDQARDLLSRPTVAMLHLRFAIYGCFAARIERA